MLEAPFPAIETSHSSLEMNCAIQDPSVATLIHKEPDTIARAAALILRATGEDVSREGLLNTPKRFSKAMGELFSGYEGTVESVVGAGVFPAEGSGLVSVREVEFYSLCEHHLLPFWGKASVAYYPQQKILGLSKIPRIIDHFSKRVQVQERITEQVADAILKTVDAKAVGVRITACHLCMMMRGIQKQASETVTEAFRQLDHLSNFERERLMGAL